MSRTTPGPGGDDLADRIRARIPADADPHERRMFGGLAFMVRGKMAVAIIGEGEIIVRLDAEQARRRIEAGTAEPMQMRGRPLRGWVRLTPGDDRDLDDWVSAGVAHALSLAG